MGMIGSHYWRNKRHGLNKCDESGREHCSDHADCCAVTACTYCFELEIYGEEVQKVSSNRTDNHWTGTVGNVSFDMYWDRDYDTDECVLIVEANGEEVYRKSCYEGQSCRDSSDETAITVDYEDAILRWIKHESRPLPHRIDPDTGCKVWFCGECECSCRELCVTVTDPEGATTKGELSDASYDDCEGPVWSGTVGEYELELALSWDIYDQCVLLVKVDGEEQDAVAVTGCKDLSATIELYDGTTIEVACKICDCDKVESKPCCGRTDLPDVLYFTVTDLVNCNCNDWLGVTIPVSKSMFTQGPGLTRWAGCYKGPCTEINGVGLLQGVTLILECTEGVIGQVGEPIDLVLFMYFGLGDPAPCPTNLDDLEYGSAPPTSTPTAFAEDGSTCSPLLIKYRFSADEFSVRCQDPMAPPGVSEIEWTLSE